MADNRVKINLIFSVSNGKEFIALGHNYLLVNKNGRFKILGKNLDEVIKSLELMDRKDIINEFSSFE
ncbi:hypothetical protein Ga0466249_002158 [Sporomusaceae bacterium BoRhaA]|uniref:hypothetical protein n=1 Tax=Pelorhabdus rhamnosifermentans TaxID=2772457 RepID=UPI001C06491C|nr:hypothetical protein [Pelorhabdus rhamnosifermentans]MBU2701047.1 hypothetical protein [Pelorhabdus rhamnosifermentans]